VQCSAVPFECHGKMILNKSGVCRCGARLPQDPGGTVPASPVLPGLGSAAWLLHTVPAQLPWSAAYLLVAMPCRRCDFPLKAGILCSARLASRYIPCTPAVVCLLFCRVNLPVSTELAMAGVCAAILVAACQDTALQFLTYSRSGRTQGGAIAVAGEWAEGPGLTYSWAHCDSRKTRLVHCLHA